jgi:hypothetical protein
MKRVLRFLRNSGELALAGVLLVAAFVTSPLWLAWLSWRWWLQLRAVEREQNFMLDTSRYRDLPITDIPCGEQYVVRRHWIRGTLPRTHALPDDPA